jgi:hypothetical protein
MLEDAIRDFTKLRNDPNDPLVGHGIIKENWYAPKIHLIQHYPVWIKSRGPLPLSSTDSGEAWHRPLKKSYRASNKGAQADEFMLKEEARQIAWKMWENTLSENKELSDKDSDLSDTEQGSELEESEHDGEELEKSIKSAGCIQLLCGAFRWEGEREIQEVERDLQLDDLVEQTMLTIRHIESGGQVSVRLRRSDIEDRGRIHITARARLKLRYHHCPCLVET